MHTTGGYLVGTAYTHWAVFDIKPETDIFWTAADIGWVTGHSYIVYGPLANGTTSVLYEGTPDTPHRGRWWEIVEKYGVTVLYCAPTGTHLHAPGAATSRPNTTCPPASARQRRAKPINPEAWMWYREHIGGNNCPIVDTWWQTENGSILISPLPGVTSTKPGAAMRALPGIVADIYDEQGQPVEPGSGGYLVITEPWPAMLRTLWGDEERYKKTYWSQYPGVYFAGDGAKYDRDGDIWVLGRVDDVLNVSGHRMSTAEIESALVSHSMVAEAAVVGAGARRDHRPSDRSVCYSPRERQRSRRCRQTAPRSRPGLNRSDRHTAGDHGRPRLAQDSVWQDYAPTSQRCCRRP